jgi:hypothetical protein
MAIITSPGVFHLTYEVIILTIVLSKGCVLHPLKKLGRKPVLRLLSWRRTGARCDWLSLTSLVCRWLGPLRVAAKK